MIAPVLPGAEDLPGLLAGKVDYIRVDRMNYSYGAWVYRQHGLQAQSTGEFFDRAIARITAECKKLGIECR